MINDVGDALRIARRFVTWDSYGPSGELGSFIPIEVTYNDKEKIWIVKCEFKIKGTVNKALVRIDESSERIKSYQMIG